MKQTFKAELKPTWVNQPSYSVEVAGNFDQRQVLQINAAVEQFVATIEPILGAVEAKRLEAKAAEVSNVTE